MLLSIIIPVYNEARTVRALLEKVRAVPLPLDRELIVIDDYSKDGTREILTNEQGITLLLHEKNRGKGAALQTGIRAARGDIVLIQDADLEYDPNDYEKIIGPLLRGEADVVYGSRFLEARNRYRLHTYLANKFLSLLTRLIVPLPVTDMETCYKAFRTPLIKGLDLTEERFGIEPEMTIKMAFVPGVRYREVPIETPRADVGALAACRVRALCGSAHRAPRSPLHFSPLRPVLRHGRRFYRLSLPRCESRNGQRILLI